MSQEIEPPGGMPFWQAFCEFTDADKYKGLHAIIRQPRVSIRGGDWVAAWSDFTYRARSGAIVAYGYPVAMTASGSRSRIAADRWDILQIKSKSTISRDTALEGGGQVFHDVRFHRAEDLNQWQQGHHWISPGAP